MPAKANSFKANTFKQDNQPRQAPKAERERPVKQSTANRMPSYVLNGKAIKIAGLFLLLLSVYFAVAFTSYLFTWQEDQSYVSPTNGGWHNLFRTTQELMENHVKSPVVDNWAGKLGALLSNQFIYEWFGIASFVFVFMFFVLGFRMLYKVRLVSLTKTLAYGFFSLVFISVSIGFFHAFLSDTPNYVEGGFGYYTNQLLDAQIGRTGTGAILVFLSLTILIIVYNIDFKIPQRKPKTVDSTPVGDIVPEPVDLEPEEISVPVEWQGGRSNRIKEGVSNTEKLVNAEPVKEQAFVQNPVFHEPLVLVPEPGGEGDAEDNDIPLTVTNERPTPVTNIEKSDDDKAKSLVEQFGTYDHKLDLASYKYPPLDLLENYGSNKINVNADELEANKNKIVETLNHYNIEIDKIKATIGPTVTLYEIIPAPGVRISKIKNLEDDIALSLAALGIRIIAPMPGKGTIGIEVPNQHPEMVSMRSVLSTEKYQNTTMDLPIALGKTISNEVFIADLAKMPHLLVAGATGQGKSVGINALLVSLLYKKHPAELKFVLVDPKKVELTLFRKIERHFLAKLPDEADAIITDTKKVVNTLNSLCIEMDARYDLLKDAQVRNLKEYNDKYVNRKISNPEMHRYLPFIVLVIDEFADLMMTAGKEVEVPIARIAQLARAVGIHLVIATQRPSVNIITGSIKANFPSRLAFRVLSKIDSRTILDSGGADQLIGRGDMLLSTGSDLIRLQCAFVDTHEVERIADYIGNQRGYPSALLLPEYVGEGEASSSTKEYDPDNRDPMFEEAARLIVLHQQGSTSLIQRKMKLGYNRAGRIIDQLEAAGIVGPFEGSKARDVLYPDEYSLERHLEALQKGEG
ncbi:DNA translocase FtsK [Mucilaginibacter sp. L3T2-6]|uniref:FtsK/SpoIIIE family DNA translocase n=1 Tax=Mucilaginibacter sp. L3T2-6 TaxID=3062491 RepID=UPI0026750310|nr:DNA translocase FtsK [Mucilaginibacter sp. L3T2-6]MDO3644771.1 DNA translocase FtsK 4TM domain-containing protein [Mucilaginibacter sp. L3T2-6]MDV6217193.1 DNA translocase FtsK 4TM domain-containing protein [Mucilaginibacter sp. L3T2-6]